MAFGDGTCLEERTPRVAFLRLGAWLLQEAQKQRCSETVREISSPRMTETNGVPSLGAWYLRTGREAKTPGRLDSSIRGGNLGPSLDRKRAPSLQTVTLHPLIAATQFIPRSYEIFQNEANVSCHSSTDAPHSATTAEEGRLCPHFLTSPLPMNSRAKYYCS